MLKLVKSAAIAVLAVSVAAPALAASQATLQDVSGSVLVARDGKLIPAAKGMVLRSGDRVVTRDGRAKIASSDCSTAVPAVSAVSVATLCNAPVTTLQPRVGATPAAGASAFQDEAAAGAGAGAGGGLSAGAIMVGVAATAAVVAGAVAGSSGSNATSP